MVDTFGEAPYGAARGYFSTDGDYGDAANLVLIDTSCWTPDHWDFMRDELSDEQRYEVALGISRGDGSLDQQDCPFIYEDAEFDGACEWTGIVYREFANRADGEEGGYTWTCPRCDSLNVYEGDESENADD